MAALPVAEALPAAPAEPNPFSFREFVRSKRRAGHGPAGDTQAARAGPVAPPLPAVPAVPAESRDEQQEEEEEEEEEEEWSESYQPLAVERAQLAALGARPGPGRVPPRQPSYEQLKEENAILRSKINKLQILSESQADKFKRAAKAESSAAKLRQENAQLQAELRNSRLEKEALQAGQAGLAAAKRNAEVALQQLLRVTTSSRASLRQLLSGAESLQLVADLLKSIDRISEVSEDGQ
ncbi:hypothetical protein DV515_00008739 [Chloebia gouldiae]|uniref:Endosome-associated-trafficking regulator 1 n=1 Tax=Chloebia gouldiae TaxID=44316 RepID=A0A3L8SEF8_CHLGU|nr:hypothetical protein DV515_00008739 [Chloebia gouldiae]